MTAPLLAARDQGDAFEVLYRRSRWKVFILLACCTGLALGYWALAEAGRIGSHVFEPRTVRKLWFTAAIFGALTLFGLFKFTVAVWRRDLTVYGDPEGLVLLATGKRVGPIPWRQIAEFRRVQFGSRLGIALRSPTRFFAAHPRGLGAYRSMWGPRGMHLQLHWMLFDSPLRRVMLELETMRRLYS